MRKTTDRRGTGPTKASLKKDRNDKINEKTKKGIKLFREGKLAVTRKEGSDQIVRAIWGNKARPKKRK